MVKGEEQKCTQKMVGRKIREFQFYVLKYIVK